MANGKTTNGERLMKLETQQTHIIGEIKDIKEMLKDHIEREEKHLEEMTSRFAAKWVEKIAWGLITIILTAFLYALIAVVGL